MVACYRQLLTKQQAVRCHKCDLEDVVLDPFCMLAGLLKRKRHLHTAYMSRHSCGAEAA
jgi:hypothetical protein